MLLLLRSRSPACGTGRPASREAAPAWSPVKITVPFGAAGGLQVNLTNNLSFTPAGATTANNIPTSIVILGQVGGGLGGTPPTTPSPSHATAQGCPSWFIASLPPGQPCTTPVAGAFGHALLRKDLRLQSMATEVAAGAPGTATASTLDVEPFTQARYLSARIRHSSFDPGAHGPDRHAGGHHRARRHHGGHCVPRRGQNDDRGDSGGDIQRRGPGRSSGEIDPVQNKSARPGCQDRRIQRDQGGRACRSTHKGNPGCGRQPVSSSTYHTCYPPLGGGITRPSITFFINGIAFDRANPTPSSFAATAGGTVQLRR